MPTGTLTNPALAQQLLDALDALSGLHPGFRPAPVSYTHLTLPTTSRV